MGTMSTEETDEITGRRGGRVVSADRQAARGIIGEKLRTMRARARLSAVALAAAIGTNRATVKSYEDGESEPLVLDALAIAAVLGVPMDVLFRADVPLPTRSSAPVAAPAPVASPAPAHAPAAAPRKAAPAPRVTPAATVAPVTPVTPAATVTTPAPAARPSPVSSALVNPFAGQASAVSIPAVSIPAASTSTPPAPAPPPAPPASTPLVRTIPAAAPRTAPVRQVATVAGRAASWAEAFDAEQIAAWGPGKNPRWEVSKTARFIACPACGAAKGAKCKCIDRQWLWAAVRPARRDQAIDHEQIAGILGAVSVDEDMHAVSLALSAPGGEWRVMIGDEPVAAVPRAEVDHAIWCGLVRLTRAESGAPVWRLTDKGRAYLGSTPGAATNPAASADPVDTGAEARSAWLASLPPWQREEEEAVARRQAAYRAMKAAGTLPDFGALAAPAEPATVAHPAASASPAKTIGPLPTPRKDLPPPAAHEVIEVRAAPAEEDDDDDADPYGYGY